MLLIEVRKDMWLEVSLRKRELILKRHLLQEARYTSFRTIMVIASIMKWDIYYMDVKISLP